jgi:hypothetical protein
MGLHFTVEDEDDEVVAHVHIGIRNFIIFQEALAYLHPQMRDHRNELIQAGFKTFQEIDEEEEEISSEDGQAIFFYLSACDRDIKLDPEGPGVSAFHRISETPSMYFTEINYMQDMVMLFYNLGCNNNNVLKITHSAP